MKNNYNNLFNLRKNIIPTGRFAAFQNSTMN